MRISDRGTYHVTLRGVPPFPASLEQQAQDRELGVDEAGEFLRWWCEAASVRGWRHPARPLAEEWVHGRRLLSRYNVKTLQSQAVSFMAEADPEWHGVKLLRAFVVWLRRGEP